MLYAIVLRSFFYIAHTTQDLPLYKLAIGGFGNDEGLSGTGDGMA